MKFISHPFGRFALICFVWFVAAIISAYAVTFQHQNASFGDSLLPSLLGGWISLHLSFLHTIQLKGHSIIQVGGRPELVLYYLGYWAVMLYLQISYIRYGKKLYFIPFIMIALLSAPYNLYYSTALMGI